MSLSSKAFKIYKRLGLKSSDRFVIICHQRSGSNMLGSMLQQHQHIEMFGQLYKDDTDFRKLIAQYDVPKFTGRLFDDKIASRKRFDYLENHKGERENRNTASFTDKYLQERDKYSSARCIGIKFHGGTLYKDEIESLFLVGGYKVIIQHRRNLLAAAISWYQAREHNQWRRLHNEEVAKPEMKMDIDSLRWFIENAKQDVALWKRLAKENRVEYLELVYEDLTDAGFNFSQVWNYLGVRDIGSKQPNTKKLIKNYDHITNLSTIKEALESKENGFL